MTILTVLPDGRIISRQAIAAAVIAATTDTAVAAVTMSELRQVEYVLSINLTTNPDTYAIPHDISTAVNAVGFTVYTGAGTTLGGDIIAIGY